MTEGVGIWPFTPMFLFERLGAGNDQDCHVCYLASYLTELGARAVLLEGHYVDRHFLDDFAGYYARSFRPIRSFCARMHFFSLEHVVLNELLDATAVSVGERDRAQLQLQEAYLGFVVERPLRRAKVGRTVLKHYPREGRRHFTTVRPYRVHLDGVELTVNGLAFQQQDGGTAVCASTALWSALQRVAPLAGHRTPTPFAVTQAARSPFPAGHGLTTNAMATALSSLGYLADAFSPGAHLEWFCAQLTGCLQSQLPVILAIRRDGEGHAVVVTGYSEPSGAIRVGIPNLNVPPILMAGGSVETLYVHDDNLGAYAHYKLLRESDPQQPERMQLMLVRGRRPEGTTDGYWLIDKWLVEEALVPKPDKLRVPVQTMMSSVFYARSVFDALGFADELRYSARFTTGVDYKRSLFASAVDHTRLRAFCENLPLPRYIAVASAFDGGRLVCDFVSDVSDAAHLQNDDRLLAIVGHAVRAESEAAQWLEAIAASLAVPTLFAPPAPGENRAGHKQENN